MYFSYSNGLPSQYCHHYNWPPSTLPPFQTTPIYQSRAERYYLTSLF